MATPSPSGRSSRRGLWNQTDLVHFHRLVQQEHMGRLSTFCLCPVHPPAVFDLPVHRLYGCFAAPLPPVGLLVPSLCQLFVVGFQHEPGNLSPQFTHEFKYYLLQLLERCLVFRYKRCHHTVSFDLISQLIS